MVDTLLFDFDGTLFDTGPGVMGCVQYAVERLGLPPLDELTLRRFVGPPLDESFMEFCGLSPERAREAVLLYREIRRCIAPAGTGPTRPPRKKKKKRCKKQLTFSFFLL